MTFAFQEVTVIFLLAVWTVIASDMYRVSFQPQTTPNLFRMTLLESQRLLELLSYGSCM